MNFRFSIFDFRAPSSATVDLRQSAGRNRQSTIS
jgi:hypothetical protein